MTSAINASKASASVVVFKSLSVIYFFCFITNILFYFGVVQWITAKLGGILNATIRGQCYKTFLSVIYEFS